MKIVNDKIYISQGETPTYDVNVYDKKTGIPYMLDSEMKQPVVEFIVRPSVYDSDKDYKLRKYLDFSDVKKFKRIPKKLIEIPTVTMTEIETNDDPLSSHVDELHVCSNNGINDFYYWDGSKWVKYVFNIKFKMDYKYTSKMEAKTYKYEVVVFDATPVKENKEIVALTDIDDKKFLLEATDFIVGGSLSE